MLNASEVKHIYMRRGIRFLYHANVVVTSLTFIKQDGLLSRGAVADRGLPQGSQESDQKDKDFGVWNNIFLDSVDIHKRAQDRNKYGPVLFEFSIDVLDSPCIEEVKVTKENPEDWDSLDPEERYFENAEELSANFQKGNFKQELLLKIRNDDVLPFDCLSSVILDNPHLEDNSYFENAKAKIEVEMRNHCQNAYLEIRECPQECKCVSKYRGYKPGYFWYIFGTGKY